VKVDSLEPQYSCPAGEKLTDTIKSSDNEEWQRHLDEAEELFRQLDDISGVPPDDSGFHVSFDHYFDNLSSRQCHDKPLPCKLVDGVNSTTCVTQDLANAVYRLGHWEYSQIYRDHQSSLSASAASYGVWPAEVAVHLREAMEGTRDTIYVHNVAHDGSVSRLLSILQLDEMVWPGMGAEVVFELYKKKGGGGSSENGYYVRVLFGGQVLKSSNPTLGKMDMIPVDTLLGYLDDLIGKEASLVKGRCDSAE
jgi:acid phosphatase